jgi:2C-methyl-D-erythritol 2,4-cyclodiphosphate synthase
MYYLNENQCDKLDQILDLFENTDYLEAEKILTIEPNERRANALLDVLARRGFIMRVGETEENLLPIIINLESSADIFKENGGFKAEFKKQQLKEQSSVAKEGTQINIHATGHGNLINTGNQNTINAQINISARDMAFFQEELKKHKVEQDDINEISAIVIAEEPEIVGYGPQAKNWIRKMLDKSMNGTWEIGIATAGGILTEIIKKFYGM